MITYSLFIFKRLTLYMKYVIWLLLLLLLCWTVVHCDVLCWTVVWCVVLDCGVVCCVVLCWVRQELEEQKAIEDAATLAEEQQKDDKLDDDDMTLSERVQQLESLVAKREKERVEGEGGPAESGYGTFDVDGTRARKNEGVAFEFVGEGELHGGSGSAIYT